MPTTSEADQAIGVIRRLAHENDALQRQVESLKQQLELARSAGPALDHHTTRSWVDAMAAAAPDAWRCVYVGDASWDVPTGLATGLGLRALVLDLIAIPSTDHLQRISWDARWRSAPGSEAQGRVGNYPPRFRNDLTVATVLRQEAPGLADALLGLITGLRSGSKASLIVQIAFLLYREDAIRMLSHEPVTVLMRVLTEQRRVNGLVAPDDQIKALLAGVEVNLQAHAAARRTLGVDAKAGLAEIKAAHRRLARQHHPDAPAGDRERFEAVQAAFELLKG